MTTDEKVKRARQIIKRCIQNVDICAAALAFEREGRRSVVSAPFLARERVGHIMALAPNTAYLALTLARMYDRPRYRKRRIDPRSVKEKDSLPVLFALLRDGKVRTRLTGRDPSSELDRARAVWKKLRRDPRVTRLRTLRNRALAHSLRLRVPQWHQITANIFGLASATMALTDLLIAAVDKNARGSDEMYDEWTRHAGDFWQTVMRGNAPAEK